MEGQEGAVVFELADWTILTIQGRDAVKFLHNFCTNDVKGLAHGQGCEAFVTNVKARVVGHVLVFADDDRLISGGEAPETALTLIATPGQAERLTAHLDRYVITEDVTIRDVSTETGLLCLAGPKATEVLDGFQATPPNEPAGPGRFTSQPVTTDGKLWPVRRADLFGRPSYLLQLPPDKVAAAQERLVELGAVAGGAAAFESLRVESRFPLYGIDVTEDHLAPEVGRPWAINYTKGCYLGQEPIARIDALGHVNRTLCGLRLEGTEAPDRGAAILAEGKAVGSVTSAASLGGGRAVAMGYLRAKSSAAGTRVVVKLDESEVEALVG